MIINLTEFHAKYGKGRPPIKGAFKDANVNPDIEIPVLTALVDYFHAKRVLEIGCNTGATSAAILAGNKTVEQCIGLDLPEIWYTPEKAGSVVADSRFQLMQLENGSKDLHAGDIEPVDFVFIDGDHSYPFVGYDSNLARSLLNPAGGIITWHDYGHPTCGDVKRWVHETNDKNFIADNGEPRIVWVAGTTICYQIVNGEKTAMPGIPIKGQIRIPTHNVAEEKINEPAKSKRSTRKAVADPRPAESSLM